MRRDIKQSLLRSLEKAHNRILISTYSLSDSSIISALNQKASEGIPITIISDKKHIPALKKKLSEKIHIQKVHQAGLMHHKIFVFDNHCFFGSSNLTSESLRMHDNVVFGIQDPALARFFETQILQGFPQPTTYRTEPFDLYLQPHPEALNKVIELLKSAKHTIQIAMFTLTHPKIEEALVQAKERGVKVQVIVDYLSQKGASKKMTEALVNSQIPTYHNRGMQLMHHKLAIIDEEHIIMGSTNWTQAGFNKNREVLILSQKLSQKQKLFFKSLYKKLLWESKRIH